jgi:FixJ family two-component response regulator
VLPPQRCRLSSAREQEVAACVARGTSNPQIAAALVGSLLAAQPDRGTGRAQPRLSTEMEYFYRRARRRAFVP